MATNNKQENFFSPVTGMVMPRYAGIATFMRLPFLEFDRW